METSTPANPRIRANLGKWMVEGVFVVIAVLVALAVDEWWEDIENQELAQRAMEAIAAEVRRNRGEVNPSGMDEAFEAGMKGLEEALETYKSGGTPGSVGVNWDVGLLSSAAWETAQVTRATQFIPISEVVEIAYLYELQGFYETQQNQLIQLLFDFESRVTANPVEAITMLRSRYAGVHNLRGSLTNAYNCTLAELGLANAEEAADCDESGDSE